MLKSYNDVKSTIILNQAQFDASLQFISENELMGFDLETNGVNPRKNKTVGIGISNLNEGHYLPIVKYDKETDTFIKLWSDVHINQFLNALNGKKLVAWNGPFEAGFCREDLQWNFIPQFHSDQMLMLHLLDENIPNYGLKENSERDFGSFAVISQQLMLASMEANGGKGKEYCKSGVQELGHYCVWDCALTVAYYLRDFPRLQQESLEKFFFEDETMPFCKHVLVSMEGNGIRLDMPVLEASLKEIREDIARLTSEILTEIDPLLADFNEWYANKEVPPKRTGPFAQAVVDVLSPESLPRTATGSYSFAKKSVDALQEGLLKSWLNEECHLPLNIVKQAQAELLGPEPKFNLLSKDHLKRLFFGKLKETALSYTEKGSEQVNDKFLELMAAKYTWAAKLQVLNRLTKLHGTYFERVYNQSENGRFYPSYFMHRTKTGRQSGDFQQLPRPLSTEDESNELIRYHNNKIRALFIADEGYQFLDADYSSLEVVVFADDAGDEALLNVIREDRDFYSEVALGAYRLAGQYSSDKKADNFLKKHKPELRQATKAFALGFRYGEDPYKLHMETGWPKDQCDQIHRSYFTAYPQLRAKMNYYIKMVCDKGYVTTALGRKRRQPRATGIYKEHGLDIMDSLALWKRYNSNPTVYGKMKAIRREMKDIINASLNFPIQGLAASIVTRAAWNLAVWLQQNCPEARIVGVIHDQIYLHCPKVHLDLVKPNMKRIMETTTKLSVPLTADPSIADNLRDGH